MKKQLLLIATLFILMAGCSKSENETPDKEKLNESIVGNKYRRLSWSIGNTTSDEYDVLEFKSKVMVNRSYKKADNSPANSVTEDLKWEASKSDGKSFKIWYFPDLSPYEGTISEDDIVISMGGSENRIYKKY